MQIDRSKVQNIIFDLGKVLLNLDFNASIKAFRELGSSGEVLDHKNAYANPIFYQLETGKITPEEFREGIRNLLKRPTISDTKIDDAWYAMIKDIPAKRVKALQKLSKNYGIYLFSNTNKIHIDRLLVEFKKAHGIDFESLFSAVYYSHTIHDRKPEVSSFEKVIELSGVVPSETLFVDDLENNIEGAQKAGLQTWWLKDGMEISELL